MRHLIACHLLRFARRERQTGAPDRRTFTGDRRRWPYELNPIPPHGGRSSLAAGSRRRRRAPGRRLFPPADHRADARSHGDPNATRCDVGSRACRDASACHRGEPGSSRAAAGYDAAATLARARLDSRILGLAQQPAAMDHGPLGDPASSWSNMGGGPLGATGQRLRVHRRLLAVADPTCVSLARARRGLFCRTICRSLRAGSLPMAARSRRKKMRPAPGGQPHPRCRSEMTQRTS